MAFLLRSSSSRSGHDYLRKKRKWPHSPFKAKWQETFCQQQAIDALKKAASMASQHPQQAEKQQSHLLTHLIESFRMYNCDPTPAAYHFVIKTLTKSSQFQHMHEVLHHLQVFEKFETPECIFTDLIKTYGDSGKIREAIGVFYRIPNFRCVPSVLSLNALLTVLCRSRVSIGIVPEILLKSQDMKIRIEESTFRILIGALCKIRKPIHAIEILRFMIQDECSLDSRACSMIVSALCKQEDFYDLDVLVLLEEMRAVGFIPGRADYINAIGFMVRSSRVMDALHLLNQMKTDKMKPDVACYTIALAGVIGEGDYAKAEELFDELLVLGVVPDVHTYNVYIDGLCKQNNVKEALKVHSAMGELGCQPNLVTYNVLLEALCKSADVKRATELLRDMGMKSVQKSSQTYRIMVGGLLSKGEISEACSVLEEMLYKRFLPQTSIVDELICALCQKGLVSEAIIWLEKLVGRSERPGPKAWETLLVSSALAPIAAESLMNDLTISMESRSVV